MNDRFKFRAYDKELRKMYEVNTICPYEDNCTKGGEVFLKGFPNFSFYFPEEVEIMQCTGLKDKNGKLIYEGDIVRLPDEDLPYMINYDEYTARYIIHSDIERVAYCFDNYYDEELEVIGNIYENKELLDERN